MPVADHLAAPELLGPARAELKAQEQAGIAEPQLACWRRIVVLLQDGELQLDYDERAADAFPPIVAAAQQSLEHRVRQCAAAPSEAHERRIAVLRQIRDLVMRSAIRAGAKLPSFDPQPQQRDIAA
jgi:hypothetical protein